MGFPDNSVGKESTCNAGDPSSIPGSGRSTEEGIGYSLQYSGLENSMDHRVYGLAKSRTCLSYFHTERKNIVNNIKKNKTVFQHFTTSSVKMLSCLL